jgi:CheY-like chemotaxis protein
MTATQASVLVVDDNPENAARNREMSSESAAEASD